MVQRKLILRLIYKLRNQTKYLFRKQKARTIRIQIPPGKCDLKVKFYFTSQIWCFVLSFENENRFVSEKYR